ncbi:MAG: HNH endonuclease [Myxococcota bacterium]
MPAAPRRPSVDVLKTPVLVLNKSYQPVRITTARHAFLLLFGGRAQALSRSYEPYDFAEWAELPVDDHEGPSLRTSSGRLRVPRLVLLADYNRVPRTPLRLSRRNVFLRDEQTCQYCGSGQDLTLDHVLPRSRGGASTWENLVACCRECNLGKGRRTPDEAKMPLRRKPVRPTWTVVVQLTGVEDPLPAWEPFLGETRRVRRSA